MECHKSAGFTLLEIMLVIVLMGLAATMVMPRLPTGSGTQDLRIASEQLMVFAQAAQQSALVEGRSIGLSVTQDQESKEYSYDFLAFSEGEWTPVPIHRLLRKVTLSNDFTMTLTPGDSFWQEALEYEASESLLEEVVTEAKRVPDVYFWGSGEVTPTRIQLCLIKAQQCREVIFEETGEIRAREFMEG